MFNSKLLNYQRVIPTELRQKDLPEIRDRVEIEPLKELETEDIEHTTWSEANPNEICRTIQKFDEIWLDLISWLKSNITKYSDFRSLNSFSHALIGSRRRNSSSFGSQWSHWIAGRCSWRLHGTLIRSDQGGDRTKMRSPFRSHPFFRWWFFPSSHPLKMIFP